MVVPVMETGAAAERSRIRRETWCLVQDFQTFTSMSWSLVLGLSPFLTQCRDSCSPWVQFSIRIFADQAGCSTQCNLRGRDLREKHSSDSRPQLLMWNYLYCFTLQSFYIYSFQGGALGHSVSRSLYWQRLRPWRPTQVSRALRPLPWLHVGPKSIQM